MILFYLLHSNKILKATILVYYYILDVLSDSVYVWFPDFLILDRCSLSSRVALGPGFWSGLALCREGRHNRQNPIVGQNQRRPWTAISIYFDIDVGEGLSTEVDHWNRQSWLIILEFIESCVCTLIWVGEGRFGTNCFRIDWMIIPSYSG